MEHTKGIWKIKHTQNVFSETGRLVASCSGHQQNFDEAQNTAENEANARLIAAAPDLLEACKEALSIIEKYSDVPVHIFALKEAIAKAEA